MIELEGIRFAYPGGREVFAGLTFNIALGERVALAGPNGAGKSTLMRIVMGLLKPSAGRVLVMGKERRTEDDFIEVRRKVGFLFQDSDDQLFCPTVEEDIAFGPLNLGHTHDEARMIVARTCAALGIEGLSRQVTHRLSGGEKRLVALATVVAMSPDCYILDEPTSGLDARHTEMLRSFILDHAPTCLISSHDRAFAASVATRTFDLG